MSAPLRPGLPVHPGTPVRVYRNLHAGCWSVQVRARVPGTANTHRWYVAGHAQSLVLDRCTFRVSEAGRRRVLRTGVKNVHAYVLGTLRCAEAFADAPPGASLVKYNPRRLPHFYCPADRDIRIDGTDRAWLTPGGAVYAE